MKRAITLALVVLMAFSTFACTAKAPAAAEKDQFVVGITRSALLPSFPATPVKF